MIKERNGDRMFEKMTRWNTIEYTTISHKNINAQYADPSSASGARLFLTYIKRHGEIVPIRKFKPLDSPVMLEDLTVLTAVDIEKGLWLEMNKDKDKVRLYQEI